MAEAQSEIFDKRLRRITRRHRKLSHGYVTSVNHDGLIIARPRRIGPRFPWKGLMVTVALFLLFKGFLYANLGEITYSERVAKLQEGTLAEQIGAYAMQADPATVFLAGQIAPLLR